MGIGDGNGCGRACAALRAGVAARARLTVAFECLADTFLGFLRLDRRLLGPLLRETDACLRVEFLDRLAALAGRFVFTPPPCQPPRG
jgi:hypothetical protein